MRSLFGNPAIVASEIGGRFRAGQDKIVREGCVFADVAKAIWPDDTDAHLASIAKRNVRTARRWLSGEFEPPNIIITAIVVAITTPPVRE